MIVYMVNHVVVKAVIVAIRKVKGGYGVFIDDKKNGKIQRTKKGNIRMKNIKTHKSLAKAKKHMAAVMIGKGGG